MLNPDFRDILSAFCDEQVEFMVVGAYAWRRMAFLAPLAILTCGFVALATTPGGFGSQSQNSARRCPA